MSDEDFEQVRLTVDGGICTITLDRPDHLNAYTSQMGAELFAAFTRADDDPDVRAVILTGAGPAFCAGADLSGEGGGRRRFAYDPDAVHEDPGGRLAMRLLAMLKPVIVAINGPAAGVGATLPLAGDLRLASETASISFAFTRLGIVPEAASAWFLPAVVGLPLALEWTLTGRRLSATEATTAGLVRSVHAPDDLLPAAQELAREIADHTSSVAVAVTRQMLWRASHASGPELAHRIASRAMQTLGPSEDTREGMAAFMQKRPPQFAGVVPDDLPAFVPWWSDDPFSPIDDVTPESRTAE